jgi:hypothetical protein
MIRSVGCWALLALLVSACASQQSARERAQEEAIVIDGIVIRNELAFPVTDVLLEVPATGAFAGCGNILPRSECRTSFEAVDYRAYPMQISWKEYGQPQKTDSFVLRPTANLDRSRSVRVEIRIYAMGQAGAALTQ